MAGETETVKVTTPAPVAPPPDDRPESLDTPTTRDNIIDILGTRYEKAREGNIAALGEKIGAEAATTRAMEQREQKYRDRQEYLIAQEAASREDLKPWNAAQELDKQQTGLWESFGSPGFLIAMLGSAFTSMPMNSALQAGAAAVSAIHAGDMDRYNKAFEAWKDNTKLALDRVELEHKEFQDIGHLMTTNMAEWRVQMEALAHKYDNKRALALLNAGLDSQAIEAMDGIGRAQKDLSDAYNHILDNKAFADSLEKKPEWIAAVKSGDADAIQKIYTEHMRAFEEAKYAGRYGTRGSLGTMYNIKTREEVKADVVKEHPEMTPGQVDLEVNRRIKESQASPMTGNEKARLQAHIGQYDDALHLIDNIESTLNRYVGAAGLAGKATRMAERISNLAGGTETDRVQMMRDIEELQLGLPRLLLDISSGRPLSAEAEHIRNIAAGLQIGDTTANTLRAMEELKDRLTKIQARARERLPDKPGVTIDKPTETKPEPAWSDFPEVK